MWRYLTNLLNYRTLCHQIYRYWGILKIHIIMKIYTGIQCEPVYRPALLLSPVPQIALIVSWGIVGYLEPGPFEKVSEWGSHHLKQNTGTTEDDTLMGTDVCSNVICRLMEFGYRCGRDPSTFTCVHDDANSGHQIPLIRADRDQEHIFKYCQQHRSFGLRFPTGWWTVFDISSVDNQGFTVSQHGRGS